MRKSDLHRLWRNHQPLVYGALIGLSCATAAFLMSLRLQPQAGQACDMPGRTVVRHFDRDAENGGQLVCASTEDGLHYTVAGTTEVE